MPGSVRPGRSAMADLPQQEAGVSATFDRADVANRENPVAAGFERKPARPGLV